MTDSEDALRAAQEAVRQALQLEDVGNGDTAEEYWREAERLYGDAGVDPVWFEHSELSDELVEPAEPMDVAWFFPTDVLEFSYDVSGEEPRGVLTVVDDIVEIRE